MKKLFIVVVLLALNIQWHYDRLCATVFSTGAYFKLDGVYCETSLKGVEFKLDELLERHRKTQEQFECMVANPDKKFMCDSQWLPPTNERDA